MRHSEFQQWLRNLPTISLAPERDALARSKRVEKFEGDLDEHFANDRMAALLARLTYSREDERSGREPRHSITFSTGANMREGTAALAGAVRLYLRFRDDVSGSTDPLLPSPSVPVSVVPGLIVIETPTRRRARYGGYPIGDGQNLVIRNILSNLGEETLSENDWKNTKQYFANKCAYCGTEGLLVIDHAVPINKAKLGEHRIGNLVPSCADCNNGKRKGGKDFIEYLSSQFSPVSEEESRERIKAIEMYMDSKDYVRLENEEVRAIIERAHKEVATLALRYISMINNLLSDNAINPQV